MRSSLPVLLLTLATLSPRRRRTSADGELGRVGRRDAQPLRAPISHVPPPPHRSQTSQSASDVHAGAVPITRTTVMS